MTKIVLVNPQMPFHAPKTDSWIRLGLAQLAAVLKQDGHEVTLIDFRRVSGWDDVINEIGWAYPDFVFITSFTSEAPDVIKLAGQIKMFHPEIKTVVGGIHASICPEDFERAGCFDYVVRGEGEIAVREIVNGNILPGTAWGETPDLDAIPYVDRTIWSDYQTRINHPPVWFKEKPWVEFINSRGCPFGCLFCSGPGEQNHYTHLVNGKRVPYVRGRSVDNVIGEMQQLDSQYHFRSIHFHDDQFILNPQWGWGFCDALKETGLDDKRWWVGSRADVILRNKDLVIEMHKRGLDIMSVGFESFSDELLQFWGKGTTAAMNFEAAAFLKEQGIRVFSNTIMGAPRADGKWHIEDDWKNIEALKKIHPDCVSWSIFTAVPGSPLYQWCADNDLIIAGNSGIRNANEDKIRGISFRKVRLLMDEIPFTRRPWYRVLHDKVMLSFEGV